MLYKFDNKIIFYIKLIGHILNNNFKLIFNI
jgi:hypothetical protein